TMTMTATQYHNRSSYDRFNLSPHYLDWNNQPNVFKDYPGSKITVLPKNVQLPGKKLSSVLRRGQRPVSPHHLDKGDISGIFLLSHTFTAKTRHADGDFYFRSVASAGALYPTEMYMTAQGVHGIENGLYHFAIHHHALVPLRQGDFSTFIIGNAPHEKNDTPMLTFSLTAIFFRSAWKYRERAYRYHLLDTGHLAENVCLALKALKLPFRLDYDFDDEKINHLLGVDDHREAALALIQVPYFEKKTTDSALNIDPLPPEFRGASRVSEKEIDYPVIREMHQAGAFTKRVTEYGTEMIQELGVQVGQWTKTTPPEIWPGMRSYTDAVLYRRSRRNFTKSPMDRDNMEALLESLCIGDAPTSYKTRGYEGAVCVGFLIGAVEEMTPGFYLLDTAGETYGLVKEGFFMDKMARICLDQLWLAHTAVHFLFLSNLEVLEHHLGQRGYRYAMLHAGRLGERLYITASSMGLGCCGIGALYDREAVELLGLNGASRLLYLVAAGPVKKEILQ
ncbi:MAG: SagB/ThcOx family dehydrogenase, partial [Deltaproteobacteria bacterium]|nr:SagB/ThcOx family dehydrogenase [Deltaproteobacteria bacterium]